MTTFFGLRGKAYSYLIDAEGTKKCAIKRKLKLKNYKSR